MKANGRIVLGSSSPRRKELLEQAEIPIEVFSSDIAEVGYGGDPALVPARITVQKVKSVLAQLGPSFDGWVIGADTIVALGQEILGKPSSAEQAKVMLEKLSGKTHKVHTGFRVQCFDGDFLEETVTTDVTFAELSSQDIDRYVETGEPMDKAGAYGIQGKGGMFVRSISGSYSNVVGLPMWEVIEKMRELGAIE